MEREEFQERMLKIFERMLELLEKETSKEPQNRFELIDQHFKEKET